MLGLALLPLAHRTLRAIGVWAFVVRSAVASADRTFGRQSQSSCLKRSAHLLLGVDLCHLAYQLGPIHIHRVIDRTGLGPTVVFKNFDHQRRVVR